MNTITIHNVCLMAADYLYDGLFSSLLCCNYVVGCSVFRWRCLCVLYILVTLSDFNDLLLKHATSSQKILKFPLSSESICSLSQRTQMRMWNCRKTRSRDRSCLLPLVWGLFLAVWVGPLAPLLPGFFKYKAFMKQTIHYCLLWLLLRAGHFCN